MLGRRQRLLLISLLPHFLLLLPLPLPLPLPHLLRLLLPLPLPLLLLTLLPAHGQSRAAIGDSAKRDPCLGAGSTGCPGLAANGAV